MRFLTLIFLAFVALFADEFKVNVDGNIAALRNLDGRIYAGLDNGKLYEYDVTNKELKEIYRLPKVESYFDGMVDSKVIDVDKIGDKFGIVYDGDFMSKKFGVLENGKFTEYPLPMTGIKKVFFLDENTVILMTIATDVLYYDLGSQKAIDHTKFTEAAMNGNVIFDRARNLLVSTCEGGVLFYFDVKTKKVLREQHIHKDNIFYVAMDGDRILTGSQDKTAYYENGDFKTYFDAGFIVYSVALTPGYGAYTIMDGIQLFDANGNKLRTFKHNREILNNMTFAGDYLVGAGYDKEIFFWSYK